VTFFTIFPSSFIAAFRVAVNRRFFQSLLAKDVTDILGSSRLFTSSKAAVRFVESFGHAAKYVNEEFVRLLAPFFIAC
jgi:hypothetical protein